MAGETERVAAAGATPAPATPAPATPAAGTNGEAANGEAAPADQRRRGWRARLARRRRAVCARIPRERRGLLLYVYCLIRSLIFDSEVLPNLKAEAIVAGFVIFGLGVWHFTRVMNEHQERAQLRMHYQVDRHEKREEAMMKFADGIPKNASYLRSICLAGLSISRDRARAAVAATTTAPAATTAPLAAADRAELAQARADELKEWRKSCPHYAALCEEIIGRFSGQSGADRDTESAPPELLNPRRACLNAAVTSIKDLFNVLNGLSLGREEINTAIDAVNHSVARTERSVEEWRRAFGAHGDPRSAKWPTPPAGETHIEGKRVDDVLAELKGLKQAPLAADATPDEHHQVARRVANELVVAIDQLQTLALRVMHVELAELPELP